MTHFNLLGGGSPRAMALWHNALQRLAASTRLGIPVSLSTDPRNAFSDNPGAAVLSGAFSKWPESLGLAAIGAQETVREHADIARQEYLAVGLRVALHPQIDLATEPRWARAGMTFGEDADLTSRLVGAYVEGLRGPVDALAPGEAVGPRERLGHGQALPGRRPAEGRRGPALPLRQGAGLPRRAVRLPPRALPCRDRRGGDADDALLRAARSGRPTTRSASASTAASSPASCASSSASTGSSAPTGV